MGAGSSTHFPVSNSEFLKKYVSEEVISSDDSTWLDFSKFSWVPSDGYPSELMDPSVLEEFRRNNLKTRNISGLMHFVISKATELIGSSTGQTTMYDSTLLSTVQNAFLVFKISAKCLLEDFNEQNFLSHLGADFDEASTLMECFLQLLLNVIIKMDVTNETYPLHCEVIIILIILLSRQMHQMVSSPLPLVFHSLMWGKCAALAPAVVSRLLRNFADDLPPPPGFLGRPIQSSFVWRAARSLAGGLWTVVTLGYSSRHQADFPTKTTATEPSKFTELPTGDLLTSDSPAPAVPYGCQTLANLSTLLLLVLTAQSSYTTNCPNVSSESNRTSQPLPLNPYRVALFSLKNVNHKLQAIQKPLTEHNVETGTRSSAATLRGVVSIDHPDSAAYPVDFSAIRDTASRMLLEDSATLLLYLLLHRNPHFGAFLLEDKNYNKLLLPLLNILYRSPGDSSHLVYMALIVLLILTENPRFGEEIHMTPINWVKWSSTRQLFSISYGSLVLLVLFRTIRLHLNHLRDKYLYVNLLASLANLSARVTNMHPYVSDSLLNLLQLLGKRYNRTVERLRHSSAQNGLVPGHETPTGNSESSQNALNGSSDEPLVQELSLLEEVIRMLLEILNSILTHVLLHNTNLIYSLLYKRDCLDSLRPHPSFQSVVQNLDTILSFFSTKIEQELGENPNSPTAIVALINKYSPNINRHCSLKKFPNLKFKYVEEESPDEFFIPYVWSIVLRQSGIPFRSDGLSLFDSGAAYLDKESGRSDEHPATTPLDSPQVPFVGHDTIAP